MKKLIMICLILPGILYGMKRKREENTVFPKPLLSYRTTLPEGLEFDIACLSEALGIAGGYINTYHCANPQPTPNDSKRLTDAQTNLHQAISELKKLTRQTAPLAAENKIAAEGLKLKSLRTIIARFKSSLQLLRATQEEDFKRDLFEEFEDQTPTEIIAKWNSALDNVQSRIMDLMPTPQEVTANLTQSPNCRIQ